MKIKFLLSILFFLLISVFYYLNSDKVYAAPTPLATFFCDNNPGTTWQVRTRMYYSEDGVWGSWRNVWVDNNVGDSTWEYVSNWPDPTRSDGTVNLCDNYEQYGFMEWGPHGINSKFQWVTSCVDPIDDFSNFGLIINPYDDPYAYTNTNISCKSSNVSWAKYKACGVTSDQVNQNRGTVNWYEACPKQPHPVCVVGGGLIYNSDNCSCSGSNTTWQCFKEKCIDDGCVTDTTKPLNDNCGTRSSCTNPPGGRSEAPFCQGAAGTDRASGIDFEWNKMPYDSGYDLQYRRTSSSTWIDVLNIGTSTSGDGKIHRRVPGSGCTDKTCDLGYNVTYEWRIRENLSTGSWTETEWSDIRQQTTSDCGAKPDLRITGFTFPGGNSGGTSNATVTILNDSSKGTGNGFNVRVNNGGQTPDIVTVSTEALAAGGTTTVTVPGINRPNAGSWTATATVDSGNAIAEENENNNDRTDNYTTTSHIKGNIFLDQNSNDVQDVGEQLYTGCVTVRAGVSGELYPTCTGSYQSAEHGPGDYNVNMNTPPPTTQYERTTPDTLPVTVTHGPNRTVNFGYRPLSSGITMHVYTDLNGNGAEDGAEVGYSGAVLSVTGNGAGSYTTNANGDVTISNLVAGTSTITLADPPPPSGWTVTTANPRTVTVPPGQVVNFGVRPPAPTCTGGMTASPDTVTVGSGVTSTLTCVNPTSPGGAPLTYTWYPGTVGTVSPTTTTSPTNSTTWNSPASTSQNSTSPSVQVCYTGTANCSNYGTTIDFTKTISGNVFIDTDKDGTKDAGEVNYTGAITIARSPVQGSVTYPSQGAYSISVPAGTYTVSYTNVPAGYFLTYPLNGPPPSFTVTVGPSCNAGGYNGVSCSNGNVINLNFGITNSYPWIQTGGSDAWFESGIDNLIPAGASCGPYTSTLGGANRPGVIFSGSGSYSFGFGQASPNPYNWTVGGLTYPENFSPATPGVIKTSYSYISSLVNQNNITVTDLATVCGAGGITNCDLPGSLPNGVYRANGNLTLTDATGTFVAGRDYVILVNGRLDINTSIDVPVGATAFFTSSGDIHVGANVGTTTQESTAANLEGWFSADDSFYIDGGATCPTPDRRLNVEGAIIINAALGSGSFVNNRDLCAGDSQCPVFYVKERPDFVLNAPLFLMNTRRVWQEVAP